MTTIELTPAEATAWADAPEGGTFWLVREGEDCACSSDGGTWAGGGGFDLDCTTCGNVGATPPAEFVQACAPCDGHPPEDPTACGGAASFGLNTECIHCRIELVGPCPRCGGTGNELLTMYRRCSDCQGMMTVTLGHAYAVGQPLPISDYDDCRSMDRHDHLCHRTLDEGDNENITDRLAHYGPPESLVGKWAVELRRA